MFMLLNLIMNSIGTWEIFRLMFGITPAVLVVVGVWVDYVRFATMLDRPCEQCGFLNSSGYSLCALFKQRNLLSL